MQQAHRDETEKDHHQARGDAPVLPQGGSGDIAYEACDCAEGGEREEHADEEKLAPPLALTQTTRVAGHRTDDRKGAAGAMS
ncbi:MAG: hypothetical protein ACYC8T_04595 [Myxococcaceae bacterium]